MNSEEKPSPSVLLLSMPWGTIYEPPLGPSILKTTLEKQKIPCKVKHLNIFLLKYLRYISYDTISDIFAFNDFLFSYSLENNISKKQLERLYEVISIIQLQYSQVWPYLKTKEDYLKCFLLIRNNIIPQFLLDCLSMIKECQFSMIGFTCMYDQTIASVAMASLIKDKYPNTTIVFGGYAVNGLTGKALIESFPFIDIVVHGEGEAIITDLAEASIEIEKLHSIPNISYRKGKEIFHPAKESRHVNLDATEAPNFEDFYFDICELKSKFKIDIQPQVLPIESSRGCWWGQKKQCIFCGIDNHTIEYRTKSYNKVVNMINDLSYSYNNNKFRFVDYVFPKSYFSSLVPAIIEGSLNKEFSCEIKSNTSSSTIYNLKLAGFNEVQAGIESFSTPILKKILKGVNCLHNIQLLKSCKTFGVQILYNILFGFPNDDVEDYKKMVKIIPLLYHFNPPQKYSSFMLTRYSPVFHSPSKFGIKQELKHDKKYDIIFSESYLEEHDFELDEYCYFFEIPYAFTEELLYYYKILETQIDYWKQSHTSRNTRLCCECYSDKIVFFDNRFDPSGEEIILLREHSIIYNHCNVVISIAELFSKVEDRISFCRFSNIISELERLRLVYRENEKIIGLATPTP